ncbi:MAG: cysteine desulfurase [Alicyclobacillus sp.]|nr:cysteine desulfurase [Alicyclobacillus sp.]
MDVYLDNAATAPILPEVREAVVRSLDIYGNPSSLHAKGVEAERLLSEARRAILTCLGRPRARIVFTGGGTEANNLAIFGVVRRYHNRGRHLVTTRIEHPSVLEAYRALEREGWRVTYVAPQPDGHVRVEDVLDAVTADTVLVSVMHVNNETGAVADVGEIGRRLRDFPKTLFHVDGIQAFGKLPNGLADVPVDLYTISGHKLGAPKGVGALVMREGLEIHPLLYGGGQEYGLRSGTENLLGIVALAESATAAYRDIEHDFAEAHRKRALLVERLQQIPGAVVHAPPVVSPYIVSVSFPGLKGEVLVHALEAEGVYVSTGSACSTKGGHSKASHVLEAMGCAPEMVTGTLRLSFARWTPASALEAAAEVVDRQVRWLYSVARKGGTSR